MAAATAAIQAALFTTREFQKRTGLTKRMIEWWCAQGVLAPRLDGHQRLFDEQQLRLAAVIRRLSRAGGARTIRRAVSEARQHAAGFLVVSGSPAGKASFWRRCRISHAQTPEAALAEAYNSSGALLIEIAPCLSVSEQRNLGRRRS